MSAGQKSNEDKQIKDVDSLNRDYCMDMLQKCSLFSNWIVSTYVFRIDSIE